jgi:hypothetical protein
VREALKRKGFGAVQRDEFELFFNALLRSGRIRPMIGEVSKLEDMYEVTTANPRDRGATQSGP